MPRLRLSVPISILVFLAAFLLGVYFVRLGLLRKNFESAVAFQEEQRVRELLDSWPCPADPRGNQRLLFLSVAPWASVELAQELVKRGFDPRATDERGLTALHCVRQNFPMAEFLVAQDLDANAVETLYGLRPLFLQDDPRIVALLIRHGADVRARESRLGLTPLHYVGNAEVASELLAAGAEVDALDRNGRTPLHWALDTRRADVMRVLIDAGADVNVKDGKGQTPLARARGISAFTTRDQKAKQDIIDLLVQHGATE